MIRKLLRFFLGFITGVIAILAFLWATGACFYDLPFPPWLRLLCAVCWLAGSLAGWFTLRPRIISRAVVLLVFGLTVAWWWNLQPSQNRDWKPEVAVQAHTTVNGDQLTVHDLRTFDYQSATSFTPRYETRTYDMTRLRGLDIFLSKWGSELMGHPVVSFDFGADGHLAFSIEIRPEKGEAFDPVGSIYRKYELIYVAADERDVVRVRTNFRPKEEVCLYRIKITPEQARVRLLEYAARLNELYKHAEWYNVATANCTTSIRAQHPGSQRLPWDWRILFNGKADEMLYDLGAIEQTYPFKELTRRSRINDAARAAGDSPDFSTLIRHGLPGFP